MSLVVVIKGPVAMAGSILNFSNVIGTNVPNENIFTMDTPPILNEHNKQEFPPAHNGDFDVSPINI